MMLRLKSINPITNRGKYVFIYFPCTFVYLKLAGYVGGLFWRSSNPCK